MNLRERLENWARYYKVRLSQDTCGSIEKRYQSNYRQWLELHEIHTSVATDMWDAQEVEKAWTEISFRHKMILKWHYITGRDPRNSSVKLKLSKERYNREFHKAHSEIKNILDRYNEIRQYDGKVEPRLSTPSTLIAPTGAVGVDKIAA